MTVCHDPGQRSLTRAEAAEFKNSDEAFGKRFEAKQQLEAYISRVEDMISDPTTVIRLKRGQKEKIEGAMSDAMAQLEIEDTEAEELRKKVRRSTDGRARLTAAGTCFEAHRHQGFCQQVVFRAAVSNRFVQYASSRYGKSGSFMCCEENCYGNELRRDSACILRLCR